LGDLETVGRPPDCVGPTTLELPDESELEADVVVVADVRAFGLMWEDCEQFLGRQFRMRTHTEGMRWITC